ncbi:putative tetratricopeptide-like helical domain superfamily, pentacotripeptide-repeat region of PRORP [Helianthus annuus]|nr:putative tetratricopeptide-like helical domain superfamily, pentacotripeptide-repeat region of PRORP [Helianthus annuus]
MATKLTTQFTLNNGGTLHRTTTNIRSIIYRQQTTTPPPRRRESVRRQMLRLNGSPMPLSRLFYPRNYYSLHRTYSQVPFTLSYSHWICSVQEQMLVGSTSNPRGNSVISHLRLIMFANPRACYLNFELKYVDVLRKLSQQIRGVCGVVGSDVESKGEDVLSLSSMMFMNPRANRVDTVSLLALNSKLKSVGVLKKMNRQIRGFCGVANSDGDDEFVGVKCSADEKELDRDIRVNSHASSIMLANPRANHVHSVSLLASNPKLKTVGVLKQVNSQIRGFCGVANSDEDDEGDDEFVGVKSSADAKEVERVCNVIEELFALDRNMEAVLDDCGVSLTHDLVVDVLERFKHARRPAFRFFSWAGQQSRFTHDSRTYNMMMSILGKTKQFETMISLLDEMGEKRLLTLETFQICIKAFAAAQQRRKAVGIFELMKKHNYKVGVDSINCLLDNLGRAKLGKEAQILFEKLKGRFTPNIQTYTVLLNGWCKVGNLLEAGKVWNEMIDKGLSPDIVAYNTMLEGLLKVHKRSDAVKLFELMKAKGPSPNERSYTIMIRDLCKQKRMKDAVEYYENMLSFGCKPDAAVYTCLITGFGNQKQMDKVYGLLKEMKENGCPPDGRMYNALIKLMTNRQMPDDAVRIYKKMIQNGIEPTIHTYNMMLKSFFRSENYDMGLAVWEEMSQKGVCPDDNSYTVFIGGLIRQGRSMEACKYLEEMIEKGMKPPQLDYNKFVADFTRAGKPNILEELARKMSLEGKLEVSDIFAGYAESLKKTVIKCDTREP